MSIVLMVFVDDSKFNSSTPWNIKVSMLVMCWLVPWIRCARSVPDGAHACFLLLEYTYAQVLASQHRTSLVPVLASLPYQASVHSGYCMAFTGLTLAVCIIV